MGSVRKDPSPGIEMIGVVVFVVVVVTVVVELITAGNNKMVVKLCAC